MSSTPIAAIGPNCRCSRPHCTTYSTFGRPSPTCCGTTGPSAARTAFAPSAPGIACRPWFNWCLPTPQGTASTQEINMPTLNDLIDGDAQRLDTGFTFTEGPLYHPNGFYYFVDVRESKFYRIKPGERSELLRENTGEA